MNADPDLTRPWDRGPHLGQLEDVRGPIPIENDCFHEAIVVKWRSKLRSARVLDGSVRAEETWAQLPHDWGSKHHPVCARLERSLHSEGA